MAAAAADSGFYPGYTYNSRTYDYHRQQRDHSPMNSIPGLDNDFQEKRKQELVSERHEDMLKQQRKQRQKEEERRRQRAALRAQEPAPPQAINEVDYNEAREHGRLERVQDYQDHRKQREEYERQFRPRQYTPQDQVGLDVGHYEKKRKEEAPLMKKAYKEELDKQSQQQMQVKLFERTSDNSPVHVGYRETERPLVGSPRELPIDINVPKEQAKKDLIQRAQREGEIPIIDRSGRGQYLQSKPPQGPSAFRTQETGQTPRLWNEGKLESLPPSRNGDVPLAFRTGSPNKVLSRDRRPSPYRPDPPSRQLARDGPALDAQSSPWQQARPQPAQPMHNTNQDAPRVNKDEPRQSQFSPRASPRGRPRAQEIGEERRSPQERRSPRWDKFNQSEKENFLPGSLSAIRADHAYMKNREYNELLAKKEEERIQRDREREQAANRSTGVVQRGPFYDSETLEKHKQGLKREYVDQYRQWIDEQNRLKPMKKGWKFDEGTGVLISDDVKQAEKKMQLRSERKKDYIEYMDQKRAREPPRNRSEPAPAVNGSYPGFFANLGNYDRDKELKRREMQADLSEHLRQDEMKHGRPAGRPNWAAKDDMIKEPANDVLGSHGLDPRRSVPDYAPRHRDMPSNRDDYGRSRDQRETYEEILQKHRGKEAQSRRFDDPEVYAKLADRNSARDVGNVYDQSSRRDQGGYPEQSYRREPSNREASYHSQGQQPEYSSRNPGRDQGVYDQSSRRDQGGYPEPGYRDSGYHGNAAGFGNVYRGGYQDQQAYKA